VNRRIGGHVSTSGGIANAVTNTRKIGGNCLQIFAGSPRMWKRSLYPVKVAEEFKQLVAKHDLNPVYIHALYLTNLASDQQELVDKSRTALIADMTNSAAIGAAGVILHIGSHQGRGWEVVREQVISEIKQVLAKTPEDSILILENSAGQKGKIGSLPELGEILRAIDGDRLKVCLDTAHAYEAGYNFASPQGLEMFIADIDKHLGWDKLDVLHVNDSKTKLGSGHDQHANIGEGYIGSEGLSRLLNHPKLSGYPILLEVPGTDKSGPDQENLDRVKGLIE
jgi:deoxyribonuclease-4